VSTTNANLLFGGEAIAAVLKNLLAEEVPVRDGHEAWSYHDAILDVANELGVKL
jgi:hypothetical protein